MAKVLQSRAEAKLESNIRQQMMKWAEDTLFTLRNNMRTQHVWPSLVYPRYDEVNEVRAKTGGWASTGEGVETLRYVIHQSRMDNARMDFFFNEYLRYVDIGVGKGRKAEDIDRTRKARYKTRYARKWDVNKRNTHRPAFMMEFRHLQRRMAWYMMERYGYDGQAYIMQGMEAIMKDL